MCIFFSHYQNLSLHFICPTNLSLSSIYVRLATWHKFMTKEMYLMGFLIFASQDFLYHHKVCQKTLFSQEWNHIQDIFYLHRVCQEPPVCQGSNLENYRWWTRLSLFGLPDIQEPINDIFIIPGLHVVSYVLVSRINEISLLVHNV